MITRIEAYRYRCFGKLGVELGDYAVLAGANGSGKTTLLDLPVLLGDLLAERVASDAFLLERQPFRGAPRAHTLTELVHEGRGDDFVLVIEARLPDEVSDALFETAPAVDGGRTQSHLRYELRLEIFNEIELQVSNEYLFLFAADASRPELGGGLQGEPVGFSARRRPRLRHRAWRPVLHRDRGGPARYIPETGDRAQPLEFRLPATQLALRSLPTDPTLFPGAVWFEEFLREGEGAVFYDPDWKVLHRASPPGQRLDRLDPAGRNLAWLALDLYRRDKQRFSDWVEHVRTALPQVVRVRAVEREEDHHAYFAVDYKGDYEVTSSGLSDGTLRVLALTLVPYLLKRPRLLVTEEPENGIHPRGIEAVLQSLTSVYGGQVWISTHSPVVLAHTELSSVFCTRMNDGGAVEVIPGERHPRLQEWQAGLGVDLGTLFSAGVLG